MQKNYLKIGAILLLLFSQNIIAATELEIGAAIYGKAFGRGCDACHGIRTNPQLAELIQAGELDIERFANTLINGLNGMPKSVVAIMAISEVKQAEYTLGQAITAIYRYLGGEGVFEISTTQNNEPNDQAESITESEGSQYVYVNGKYWRQLTKTVNISQDELADIYDTNTGQLKDPNQSVIRGVDFSGYTWASRYEVDALLSTLPGLARNDIDAGFFREKGAQWASYFFDTLGFKPLGNDARYSRIVSGYTRSIPTGKGPSVGRWVIVDLVNENEEDYIDIFNSVSGTGASPGRGHWMYVNVENTTVPSITTDFTEQTLSVSVGMNSGSKINENADWWIVAYNNQIGLIYFDLTLGWTSIEGSLEGLAASYQGALLDFEPIQIFSGRLPAGTYDFYFAIDMLMNGKLDEPLLFDHVKTVINE